MVAIRRMGRRFADEILCPVISNPESEWEKMLPLVNINTVIGGSHNNIPRRFAFSISESISSSHYTFLVRKTLDDEAGDWIIIFSTGIFTLDILFYNNEIPQQGDEKIIDAIVEYGSDLSSDKLKRSLQLSPSFRRAEHEQDAPWVGPNVWRDYFVPGFFF